ncbi:MAG: sigma-54 dependent transcriptional regulator [Myxococcota bacterium]
MTRETVLLVEDDASLREVMAFQLQSEGYRVIKSASGAEALTHLEHEAPPAVVITDLKMPHMDGFQVLAEVRKRAPLTPVLVVTAFGNVETAVQAMRGGAFDFVSKPFHKDQFLLTVQKAVAQWRLLDENERLKEDSRREGECVAVSPAMREVLAQARQVANTTATVLLLGESGAGKEVLAREIHRASDRRDKPFVAINCAAIPKDLLEAELFGFARGAFTGAHKERVGKFQAADGGTLFLDEIGDLDDALQAKILRVLENRTVDVIGGGTVPVNVRIIAATHRDLAAEVAAKRFRQDLFFRLAVIPLRIPPLRSRPEDASVLFARFIRRFSGDANITMSDALLRAVERRAWPGNVRELRNVAERMVALRKSDSLDVGDLPPEDAPGAAAAAQTWNLRPGNIELPPEGVGLEELERAVIEYALEKNAGNVSAAARFLKVPRHILVYRIEKFGISP